MTGTPLDVKGCLQQFAAPSGTCFVSSSFRLLPLATSCSRSVLADVVDGFAPGQGGHVRRRSRKPRDSLNTIPLVGVQPGIESPSILFRSLKRPFLIRVYSCPFVAQWFVPSAYRTFSRRGQPHWGHEWTRIHTNKKRWFSSATWVGSYAGTVKPLRVALVEPVASP